jgi:hypothetical protein
MFDNYASLRNLIATGKGSPDREETTGKVEIPPSSKSSSIKPRMIRQIQRSGNMCPVCIANAASMVAGAGCSGGILAVCIRKLRQLFSANRFGLIQRTKEK